MTSTKTPTLFAHLVAAALLPWLSGCARSPDYNGQELYMANCANCHGIYAEGDGPAAAVISTAPGDLRYLSASNDHSFPRDGLRMAIDGRSTRLAHGDSDMPVWGTEFLLTEGFDQAAERRVAAKIDALVDYLESIQLGN